MAYNLHFKTHSYYSKYFYKSFEIKFCCRILIYQEGQNPIQNEALLRKYDFFQLKIHLKKGKDLIARDKNGSYQKKFFSEQYQNYVKY